MAKGAIELETAYLEDGQLSQRLPKRIASLRKSVSAHQNDPKFVQSSAELKAAEDFLIAKMTGKPKVPLEEGLYSVAIDEKDNLTGVPWRDLACGLLQKVVLLRAELVDLANESDVNKLFKKLGIPTDGPAAEEERLKKARTVSSTKRTARIFRDSVELKFR